MGSWSVYCSISRITITSGRKCVFLPLIKNSLGSGSDYDEYIPATLPIFGEYNDYGGLEEIVRDENVELIEKMYKCTIEEFCDFLTDGRKDYDDKYSDWHGKEHLKLLEEMTYMWVDGKVWEFMVNYHADAFHRTGAFDMGKPELLKALGFEYIGKSDDKRYTDHYRYSKGDVVLDIVTDGTWMHKLNDKNHYGIYNIKDLKKLGVDTTEFDGKEETQVYKTFSYKDRVQKLGWVIGIPRTYTSDLLFGDAVSTKGVDFSSDIFDQIAKRKTEIIERLKSMFSKHAEGRDDFDVESYLDGYEKVPYPKDFYASMIEDNDFVCQSLSDMVILKRNMHCASIGWEPYVLYQTPQCGEFKAHQGMLDAFASINREIMTEMGYDEDEDDE